MPFALGDCEEDIDFFFLSLKMGFSKQRQHIKAVSKERRRRKKNAGSKGVAWKEKLGWGRIR